MIMRVPVIITSPDDDGKADFIIVGQRMSWSNYHKGKLVDAAKAVAYLIHKESGLDFRTALIEHLSKLEELGSSQDLSIAEEYDQLLRECKWCAKEYEVIQHDS